MDDAPRERKEKKNKKKYARHLGIDSIEQTGSNGGEEGTNDEEPIVSAVVSDGSTREHGTSDDHHHEWKDINSRARRGVTLINARMSSQHMH